MKKKILIAASALLIFGLAIVALSYSGTSTESGTAMSCCCCSGESCPMKQKDAAGKEVAMSHENCDCCKGEGDSCPMMKKDAEGKPMKMDGASCCPMAKDGKHAGMKDHEASCPMMKKDDASGAKATDVKMHDMKGMDHDMKGMHGEGCSCACCNHEHKDAVLKDAPPA